MEFDKRSVWAAECFLVLKDERFNNISPDENPLSRSIETSCSPHGASAAAEHQVCLSVEGFPFLMFSVYSIVDPDPEETFSVTPTVLFVDMRKYVLRCFNSSRPSCRTDKNEDAKQIHSTGHAGSIALSASVFILKFVSDSHRFLE